MCSRPLRAILISLSFIWVAGLVGCSTTRELTIDDGRPIADAVMSEILAFGEGQRRLRPAIHRSALLADADCEKQWELPFAAFSVEGLPLEQRVAWVRALGMDERLRVIASSPASPLELGERIMAVGAVRHADGVERMASALNARREAGSPFTVEVQGQAGNRLVSIEPFQVCRGLVQLTAPSAPGFQQYHWEFSIHSLDIAQLDLTDDEALWVVLWTQGLAQEGAFRMKAIQYGLNFVNTAFMVYQLASVANPVLAAGQVANKMIADQAARTAVTELGKQQIQRVAKDLAIDQAQQKLQEVAESVMKGQGVAVMQRVAANRGRLTGISYVASSVFDQADAWAAERMPRLQADPLAAFTLHQKLSRRELVSNGLIFDEKRFEAAIDWAAKAGLAAEAYSLLEQWSDSGVAVTRDAMPLMTDRRRAAMDDELRTPAASRPVIRERLPSTTSPQPSPVNPR